MAEPHVHALLGLLAVFLACLCPETSAFSFLAPPFMTFRPRTSSLITPVVSWPLVQREWSTHLVWRDQRFDGNLFLASTSFYEHVEAPVASFPRRLDDSLTVLSAFRGRGEYEGQRRSSREDDRENRRGTGGDSNRGARGRRNESRGRGRGSERGGQNSRGSERGYRGRGETGAQSISRGARGGREATWQEATWQEKRRDVEAGWQDRKRDVARLGGSSGGAGGRTASAPRDAHQESAVGGVRINKCFKEFASRRESDEFIRQGRVRINNVVAGMGDRVVQGDKVTLDGTIVRWEDLAITESESEASNQFTYIKYNKPRGVVCTTDTRIRNNIVDAIGHPERIFPVGRLDKDSTGLILLTSDGRLPNAVLRSAHKKDKEYIVTVDKPLQSQDIEKLANGVVITTTAQRDGRAKTLTARTKPCYVRQVSKYVLEIILQEGRNRQIRKMLETLGYEVLDLHREKVMGISTAGIQEGQWRPLSRIEMELVNKCMQGASSAPDLSASLLLGDDEAEAREESSEDEEGEYEEEEDHPDLSDD